jgi:hypothetical protein
MIPYGFGMPEIYPADGLAQQERPGEPSYMHEKTLNSLIGTRSYEQVRRILSKAIGIDRFGHFAGLTTSPQFLIWPVERCARAS